MHKFFFLFICLSLYQLYGADDTLNPNAMIVSSMCREQNIRNVALELPATPLNTPCNSPQNSPPSSPRLIQIADDGAMIHNEQEQHDESGWWEVIHVCAYLIASYYYFSN